MEVNGLSGILTRLRPLEPTDLELLYKLENDETVWEISNTSAPYSKFVLKQYLDNAHRDIYEVKQLRLVIEEVEENRAVGFVDLFDFDPRHRRAGVGIIVYDASERGKGYGKDALQVLSSYAFRHLNLHQLFAHISEDNTASISLFEQLGYKKAGMRKDWLITGSGYKNDLIYQLINEES